MVLKETHQIRKAKVSFIVTSVVKGSDLSSTRPCQMEISTSPIVAFEHCTPGTVKVYGDSN